MIILWTDALFFALMAALSILVVVMFRQPDMERPLKKLGQSRIAMSSLVVLLLFTATGLLDSVHFKDSRQQTQDVISLLDYGLETLRTRNEKTYSAPFAAHLYSKEATTDAGGRQSWDYPRLSYGGAHLANPAQERVGDIMLKSSIALSQAAGCLLVLFFLGRVFCRRWCIDVWQLPARRAALWTFVLLFTGGYALVYLSSYYHVFGTDKVGEDVFYQAIKSIRTGLIIGALTTVITLPLAIVFGIMAGFFRGWVDDVIQFVYTTLNSIPGVLLIAASILMVQVYMAKHPDDFNSVLVRADMRLLFLCLILGVTSWTSLCRLLRAETLKLREMEYVQAAQALGVGRGRILWRHILPNVMHIVLISVVLDFSSLVLAEAVLSYINIGVDPTTYSWGNMINGARLEMARDPIVWWSLAAAFVFMFTLVLAANLFADIVRNAFDPRRGDLE